MEVGQAKFVTHLIITVQLYYYLKTRLLKFGQSVCKFIGKSNERIFCKLNKSEILRLYSIVGVAMETTKTSNFTGQSKFFISIFFTCQVSACELQPFSCHDLANDIHSQTAKIKLCSATLTRPVSLPKPVMDTWNVVCGSSRIYKCFFDHLNVMPGGLKMVGNTVHPERRRWSEKMKPIRLRFNDTRSGS